MRSAIISIPTSIITFLARRKNLSKVELQEGLNIRQREMDRIPAQVTYKKMCFLVRKVVAAIGGSSRART